MFGNLGNLADLMKNAGKIKEQMEQAAERLGEVQTEGVAGGGAVKSVVNGRLELISVRFDPNLVDRNDLELLEDLTVAAVNQALSKAREEAAKAVTGNLPAAFGGLSGMFPGGVPSTDGPGTDVPVR